MISKLDKLQFLKVVKATLYVGASASISYLITLTTKQPDLFGIYTVLVNSLLVFVKQLFTETE